MKFYFVELTHKSSGQKFYKFGITGNVDVLDRFTNTFPEREGYQNFNIRVLFSQYFKDDEVAKELEKKYLNKFPRINLNEEIIDNYEYTYKNTGGITEWRILDRDQVNSILKELYESRPY